MWGKPKLTGVPTSQYGLSDFIAQRESSEGLASQPLPAMHTEARGMGLNTDKVGPRSTEQAPAVLTKIERLPQSLNKGQATPRNYKTLCSLQRVVFSFISYCN